MTLFKPCIDLHKGRVKQIVGGTLKNDNSSPATNFVSEHDAAWYATLYQRDNLKGGHVIKLGPGNDLAAQSALAAWPRGLQIGGGITIENALKWLDMGAGKVIVTSWFFDKGNLSFKRVEQMAKLTGPEKLVIDLSCRKVGNKWFVATDRWQTITKTEINETTLKELSAFCSEYLIHAADVEGLCNGIDLDLIKKLAKESPIPCTYAGGANHINDLKIVKKQSNGRIDLTYGSALDLFGGKTVAYKDCVKWNREQTVKQKII